MGYEALAVIAGRDIERDYFQSGRRMFLERNQTAIISGSPGFPGIRNFFIAPTTYISVASLYPTARVTAPMEKKRGVATLPPPKNTPLVNQD